MKLIMVDFTFENCERINVPADMIKMLICDDIRETVVHMFQEGDVERYKTCYKFTAIVTADSNQCTGWIEENKGFCDRATECDDITGVTLFYDDGSSEEISIHWSGDDEYVNMAQKTEWIANHKRLYITVGDSE